MKPKDIINGWKNWLFTDDEVEKIAADRLAICNTCPEKDSMLNLEVCRLCHCPLVAKTRSIKSECPKGLWQTPKSIIKVKDMND